MIAPLVPRIAGGALCAAGLVLATAPGLAQNEAGSAPPDLVLDGSQDGAFAIRAMLDESRAPLYRLESEGERLQVLIALLADRLDFQLRLREGLTLDEPVHGELEGRGEDILRYLLRRHNYAVVTAEDDPGRVRVVVVLDRLAEAEAPDSGAMALDAGEDAATAWRRLLDETPENRRDLRAWLEARLAQAEGEEARPVELNLHDLPVSPVDRMQRRLEPLAGDYDEYRLENTASGAAPRHLREGNNAAALDMQEALRRTTYSATQGVGQLSEALDGVCFRTDCVPETAPPSDPPPADPGDDKPDE